MATVIDNLIVKLGLDPKDFTKGEKEAAAGVLDLERKTKSASSGIGRELTGMAAKWLTVGAAIAAIKKGVSIIDDVAERTRRLGIDSKNYGMAAAEMRNFENAAQIMGGSADEARKSIAGLQQSVFNLAYNGQVSDSLVMLARLGVQFQDASGKARNFKDIALDTADAIAQAQEQGMSRENAFQFLQQSGFDQGTAQLILSGRSNMEKELAAQATRRQVSGEDIQKATDIRRASIGKDQSLENAKIMGMNAVGGIQQTINEMIENPSQAMDKLTNAATNAGTALENWALKATGQTRGLRNNNPMNLKAVGGQMRDREGFRVFGSQAEGLAAAERQLELYGKRGINTIESIINTWAPAKDKNNVPAYIADVAKRTGIDPTAELLPSQLHSVMSAMGIHESGAGAPSESQIDAMLGERTDDSVIDRLLGGNSVPTAGARGNAATNVTKVQIDSITVNSRATDAEGVAGDLSDALERKLMTAHAETGLQ